MAEEIVYEEHDESYDTDQLTDLAEQQLKLEIELDALNRGVKEKKEELEKISKGQLPRAMSFLRMGSFSLISGQGITIKKNYFGSIKDNEEDAIAYLKKYELDDIVKNVLTIEFPRGQEKMAAEAFDNLSKMGYDIEQKQSIHASTLKSFIKERMEEIEKLEDLYMDLDGTPCTNEADGWEKYLEFAQSVHMEHDLMFPKETFKAFIIEEAKIKEPKRKKKK
jgi:hypothetical protein